MADDIDKANDLAELERQNAINNARVTGNENLTGMCRWCKEVTHGAFCSPECRTDYTRRERFRG